MGALTLCERKIIKFSSNLKQETRGHMIAVYEYIKSFESPDLCNIKSSLSGIFILKRARNFNNQVVQSCDKRHMLDYIQWPHNYAIFNLKHSVSVAPSAEMQLYKKYRVFNFLPDLKTQQVF